MFVHLAENEQRLLLLVRSRMEMLLCVRWQPVKKKNMTNKQKEPQMLQRPNKTRAHVPPTMHAASGAKRDELIVELDLPDRERAAVALVDVVGHRCLDDADGGGGLLVDVRARIKVPNRKRRREADAESIAVQPGEIFCDERVVVFL